MSGVVYPPRWAYWTILMFHLTFKIVGFSTISLQNSNPTKNQQVSFAKSKFGIFYNVLLSCVLAGLSFVSLPELASHSYLNKTSVTLTIEMIQSMYGVLMMCTILLCYAFRWSTLNRICNHLVQIEGQFSFSRERISLRRTLRVLLAVHTIQTVMFVVVVVSEELAFHNGPIGWSLDSVPTAFAASIFFQYFSVISLMTVNFARANQAFENLCRTSQPAASCSKSLNRCRRVFVNCSIMQSLRRLRSIYDDLCYVCSEISQFYSFPALLVVPYIIYSLLFNTYYLLQPLFDDNMDFDLVTFCNTVALIVYLIYPLGMLTSKVTDILDEVRTRVDLLEFATVVRNACGNVCFSSQIGKTGVIVHSLLKNAIDREAKSEVKPSITSHNLGRLVYTQPRFFQLKQFSLQLLHRQIKFTASEYFDLNNSLFQSVSKQT